MAAITVTNTDWSIISDTKSALSGATVSGATVFKSVTATTSEFQAEESQFRGSPPLVIVRYVHTTEDGGPEDIRNCIIHCELILATKVDSGRDESCRLQEILRLTNATKNAIEADPPSGASACGDGDFFHRRIAWGKPAIDLCPKHPWAICKLPVEFAYVLDNGTSH